MNTTGRKTVKGRTTSAPKKIEKASAKAKVEVETAEAKVAPTHDEIALRAYQLYLARGSEPGHESEDWLAAEAELSI